MFKQKWMTIKGICVVFALALGLRFSTAQNNAYEVLCNYMTGSFSSEAQSIADSNYFDIRLHMSPIWPQRTDGYWLYVEQAMSTAMDKPYRQRVYQVVQINDSVFESRVYEFPEPAAVANAWKDSTKLRALSFENLQLRDGCAIVLKYHSNTKTFIGETGKLSCPSSLRGASYATSEVRIDAHMLLSWDRGWDASGKQVWGAVNGAYQFTKIK